MEKQSSKITVVLLTGIAIAIIGIVATADYQDNVAKCTETEATKAAEIITVRARKKSEQETTIAEVETETITNIEVEETESNEEDTYWDADWNNGDELTGYSEEPTETTLVCEIENDPSWFAGAGVIYWNGWRWTWYSENVLPGDGLDIPGRWSDGNFVRDCDGYICVASSDLDYETVIETPFGAGKVYDCGCSNGTIDMYVSW